MMPFMKRIGKLVLSMAGKKAIVIGCGVCVTALASTAVILNQSDFMKKQPVSPDILVEEVAESASDVQDMREEKENDVEGEASDKNQEKDTVSINKKPTNDISKQQTDTSKTVKKEETPVVEQKPAEEQKPSKVETPMAGDNEVAFEGSDGTQEQKPSEGQKPAEEQKPLEEQKPTEEQKPSEEQKPAEEPSGDPEEEEWTAYY